jgi:hypothetical protein
LRVKTKLAVLALGAAFAVVTAVITLRLRAEADQLRAEKQRLQQATARLATQAAAVRRDLAGLATGEAAQASAAAALATRLSPEHLRLVHRGLEVLRPPAVPGPPAPHAASIPLRQSKIGTMYFPLLLDRPDYARAAGVIERLEQEEAFAPFFRILGLAPDRRARFVDLLVDRAVARQDIAGLNPGVPLATENDQRRKAVREWRAQAVAEFGETTMNQFFEYDGTLFLREAVEQLAVRTSHLEPPLRDDQAAAVLDALTAALGKRVGSRFWLFPDAVLDPLRKQLTPAQFSVLLQIREERLTRAGRVLAQPRKN